MLRTIPDVITKFLGIDPLLVRMGVKRGEAPDFIVTGIPRSGTSLLTAILSEGPHSYCFNEVHYDLQTLPDFFERMRSKIMRGEPIPNKFGDGQRPVEETQKEGGEEVEVKEKTISKQTAEITLGSKVNIPYLNQLPTIILSDFNVLAVVRHPVYTIASWNSEKATSIPESEIIPGEYGGRWDNIPFFSNESMEMQTQVWNHYADLIWTHRSDMKIIKYEQLSKNSLRLKRDIEEFLKIPLPDESFDEIKNFNRESRYNVNFGEIRNKVQKFCPTRKHFGYD